MMKIFKYLSCLSLAIFLLALVINPNVSLAAEKCIFDRNLILEDTGEDVKCLQKYLNASGFIISPEGIGSVGRETTQFKGLTKKALISWQVANGITPASGYFGPVSRQKYLDLINSIVNTVKVPLETADEIRAKIALVTAQLDKVKNDTPITPAISTGSESKAQKAIEDALDNIHKAENQIEDAEEDGENIIDATNDIGKSRSYFFDAITAYFEDNFSEVIKLAGKSDRYSDDAIETAGGKTDEIETEEYLDEVQDDIDIARNEIEDADGDGRDVSEAEDLLDEAEDVLDQANDKFDDGDFDEARDLAEEAEDRADEAVDSIGNTSKTEAKNAINDAQNAIDDAQDAIDDADNVDEAEDLLDQANNKLDDARDEYSDGQYDNALDLAEEAEDLANDARREV